MVDQPILHKLFQRVSEIADFLQAHVKIKAEMGEKKSGVRDGFFCQKQR